MQVDRLNDAAEFLEAAGPLLLAEEARHNLMLGLAGTIRDHPGVYPAHHFWVVLDSNAVVGAALRTPPHNLIVAKAETEALEALARDLDDEPAGVVGSVPEVDDFVRAWQRKTGCSVRRVRDQGLFSLETVQMPTGVTGRMRPAGTADRDLLADWWIAFVEEAIGDAEAKRYDAERAVGQRLTIPGKGVAVWDDDGPVSFAAFGDPTPNGVRIGPVYTPPQRRGRGYASALVAQLSQQLLDQGRRFCFLYTDLANPTANRIYERIGYARVCESTEFAFERA